MQLRGRSPARGFTLIELVSVIVILSILAVGTTVYIVNAVQQYDQSAERLKLAGAGRVAIEQMSRRLRNALPNSIRIGSGQSCIEYFPVVAASVIEGLLPVTPATVSSIDVADFELLGSQPFYVAVYPIDTNALYQPGLPSPGPIAATNAASFTAGTHSSIALVSAHAFSLRSPTNRLYIVQSPERFCVVGDELRFYQNYGIPSAASEPSPSAGSGVLIADGLDAANSSFTYQGATLVSNAMVRIELRLVRGGDPLPLSHRVHLRNLP